MHSHWAEIYGWPQRWVAVNETTHPEGTNIKCTVSSINGLSRSELNQFLMCTFRSWVWAWLHFSHRRTTHVCVFSYVLWPWPDDLDTQPWPRYFEAVAAYQKRSL